MRILIAEDEVTIARALKVMLEKNKYVVDTELGRSLKPILDSTWAWGEGYKAKMQ